MQRIFDAECSAEEYQRHGREYPFPDLTGTICPQCGGDFLRLHGYYSRYLILADFMGMILVRRHICRECGRTVSLLPSFAHPGRGYGTAFLIGALMEFYGTDSGVCAACRGFSSKGCAPCSRQQLRWLRTRIEENLNFLIMETAGLFGVRAPPIACADTKKGIRQLLSHILRFAPEDVSLKIFERTGRSCLTANTG
jgi:hypothetical protein